MLLPGQFYPTRAPVLWFAREAVMAAGWSALEVLGEPGLYGDALRGSAKPPSARSRPPATHACS